MTAFTPVQNLKNFISNGPPLVIFTLCLTIFAITTLSLAYYIGDNINITNPDIAIDWNMFIHNFADNDFCLLTNVSRVKNSSLTPLVNQSLYNSIDSPVVPNITVSVISTFSVLWPITALQNNISVIQGVVPSAVLNPMSDNYNVTMVISLTGERDVKKCDHSHCAIKQSACVTFRGPQHVLPRTRMPQSCAPPLLSTNFSQPIEVFAIRFSDVKDGQSSVRNVSEHSSNGVRWCGHGLLFELKYFEDPDLTVMLSVHDRSIINLHLMHTSYFLFVMVITVFCYAILKGKKASDCNNKGMSHDKMQLDT